MVVNCAPRFKLTRSAGFTGQEFLSDRFVEIENHPRLVSLIVSRFQREARVLASLNHSNIAAIYSVEETDSRHFLVMELVVGETLADRIKRGAIPIEEYFFDTFRSIFFKASVKQGPNRRRCNAWES